MVKKGKKRISLNLSEVLVDILNDKSICGKNKLLIVEEVLHEYFVKHLTEEDRLNYVI